MAQPLRALTFVHVTSAHKLHRRAYPNGFLGIVEKANTSWTPLGLTSSYAIYEVDEDNPQLLVGYSAWHEEVTLDSNVPQDPALAERMVVAYETKQDEEKERW